MAVTLLMLVDFGFFREQICIVACPYGRFQSVMLDRRSLIVGYDTQRGEPRGRMKRSDKSVSLAVAKPTPRGDCIDCEMCVTTCPTGIDIREGLQMECIGCAQCIDACDAWMDRIGKPRGLIRYSSQEAMESGKRRILRPRVFLYPAILCVISIAFVVVLTKSPQANISLHRIGDRAYLVMDDGSIRNDIEVRIINRTNGSRQYFFDVTGVEGVSVLSQHQGLTLEAGVSGRGAVSVLAPREAFVSGRAPVVVTIHDDTGYERAMNYRLQGPWGGHNRIESSSETAP